MRHGPRPHRHVNTPSTCARGSTRLMNSRCGARSIKVTLNEAKAERGVAVQMGDVAVTSESMSRLFRRKGSRCWPGVWFPLMRSSMSSTLDDLSTSRGCAPETAISVMPTATAPCSYHWIWRKRFDRLLTRSSRSERVVIEAARQPGFNFEKLKEVRKPRR